MKNKTLLTLVCMALLSADVMAADSIAPGVYITEGNWGSMEVSRSAPDSPLKFTINAMGANGHSCDVEGEIQNNQATTEEKCVIQFEIHPDRLSVIVRPESNNVCHRHCGMRAWFPGDYFPVIPFCRQSKSIREEFSFNYKSGRYQKARDLLVELLGKCERFTDWQIQAEVRNDLAVTEFHLGDKTACLKALEPIKRAFIDDPDKTGVRFTPSDEEWGEAMMKTTRFNWKKCGGLPPVYSDSSSRKTD